MPPAEPTTESLLAKVDARRFGICLYGLAPPKRSTSPERLAKISSRQIARVRGLAPDGLIVYDIQDEAGRTAEPRPFPFLPTIDPETYADKHLGELELTKIIYRSVGQDDELGFRRWLAALGDGGRARAAVFVGSPTRATPVSLPLSRAYALAREHAPDLVFGGIAIAERHARRLDEHERLLAKLDRGCRFFVTQAVYDVTATKSLLSDLHLALAERSLAPPPIILTFSPCASTKTLAFMKWLGISVPRWLDNELRYAPDPLAT